MLRTSWSLSLPDEFKYVEFSGNVEGARAVENLPLVARAWTANQDRFVQLALFLMLGLAVAASETARGVVVGIAANLANAFLALVSGLAHFLRGIGTPESPIRKVLKLGVVVSLVAVLALVVLGSLSSARSKSGGGGGAYYGPGAAPAHAPDGRRARPVRMRRDKARMQTESRSAFREADKAVDGNADSLADESLATNGPTPAAPPAAAADAPMPKPAAAPAAPALGTVAPKRSDERKRGVLEELKKKSCRHPTP